MGSRGLDHFITKIDDFENFVNNEKTKEYFFHKMACSSMINELTADQPPGKPIGFLRGWLPGGLNPTQDLFPGLSNGIIYNGL